MYEKHVPILTQYGQTSDGFADIVVFAICTQNQRFYNVAGMLKTLHVDGVAACRKLTLRQKDAIVYAYRHAGDLQQTLPACTVDAMRVLVELPGIGIVKAGFILQMLGYPIGCLDVHNLRLAGLAPKVFARIPASAEGLTHKIHVYRDVCHTLGGAERLWDDWCTLISLKYPRWFPTAEHVSSYHVACIIHERW